MIVHVENSIQVLGTYKQGRYEAIVLVQSLKAHGIKHSLFTFN